MNDSPSAPARTIRHRRPRRRGLSETQFGYLLLAPALLTLALVMLYPVATVLWQSLHFERLNQPFRGTPFVGLENFSRMLGGEGLAWDLTHRAALRLAALAGLAGLWWLRRRARIGSSTAWLGALGLLVLIVALGVHPAEGGRWSDPRFWNAFGITLLISVVSVAGSFLVGMPLALLANLQHPFKWLVRVALLLPWAMPRVFTGLTFAWLFQSDYGVINDLLGRGGITELLRWTLPDAVLEGRDRLMGPRGILWLAREVPAIVATNLAIIWKTSSFVGLILLAGLQSIDATLYEAAVVDGATRWQRFWRITLPLLRPAIAVALIFRTLTALQTFDIPFALTGGGPGRALETLGVYIYKTANGLDIGYAAALTVALFVLSLTITTVYLRWIHTDD